MHFLVTGGAGFIGSHLCERLLRDGHNVTVLDDLSTGAYANVGHLEGNPSFRMVIDTVLNRERVEELVKPADAVFHLASAVGVKLVIEQPVKAIKTIMGGTEIVLDAAARFRKRFLVTSTSEVYGKGSKVPFSENDDTVQGATAIRRWAYAGAKAMDEFLALAHWHETRLPVICPRLFNTVGPRQTGRYGMVIPRFVNQALSGEPITVYGDGTQSRCFCHVHDVVDALVKLTECRDAFGRVVNIGNPEEITINALAERIKSLTGSASPIRHIPYDVAYEEGFEDMVRRVPDLTLAAKLIGFAPRLRLDDILNDVVGDRRNARTFNA
ncbi:MAG: GDP-mannose 4,6-dehydratase [Kiritimatiellae bacterium]|nr:GDP-mannose 4,6-dehydratase [Kiritimatiellia bacterium]